MRELVTEAFLWLLTGTPMAAFTESTPSPLGLSGTERLGTGLKFSSQIFTYSFHFQSGLPPSFQPGVSQPRDRQPNSPRRKNKDQASLDRAGERALWGPPASITRFCPALRSCVRSGPVTPVLEPVSCLVIGQDLGLNLLSSVRPIPTHSSVQLPNLHCFSSSSSLGPLCTKDRRPLL
jgi:hypothetical protein